MADFREETLASVHTMADRSKAKSKLFPESSSQTQTLCINKNLCDKHSKQRFDSFGATLWTEMNPLYVRNT